MRIRNSAEIAALNEGSTKSRPPCIAVLDEDGFIVFISVILAGNFKLDGFALELSSLSYSSTFAIEQAADRVAKDV